jgi:two-component system, LuxR family, sensor kinase FixL
VGSVIDRMRGLLKRHNLNKRPVDVGELVGEVIAPIRSDVAARHVKLEFAVADNLRPCLATTCTFCRCC